jgi:hypothetical protein
MGHSSSLETQKFPHHERTNNLKLFRYTTQKVISFAGELDFQSKCVSLDPLHLSFVPQSSQPQMATITCITAMVVTATQLPGYQCSLCYWMYQYIQFPNLDAASIGLTRYACGLETTATRCSRMSIVVEIRRVSECTLARAGNAPIRTSVLRPSSAAKMFSGGQVKFTNASRLSNTVRDFN